MSETFNCPNCGAPLDYQGSDPIIRCPYCSTSVVVPENLRAQPSFSSKPDNFTLAGAGGDMAGMLQKARRFKEVRDLARAGQTEQAIKIYREITDGSRTDAEAAVQALSQGQPIMLTGLTAGTSAQALELAAQAARQAAQAVAQSESYTPSATIETSAASGPGRAGCLVGCFITAVTLVIVGAVFFFAAGGAGMLNSLTGLDIPSFSYATQVLGFGSKGTGPGLFTDVRGIAVNPATGAIFAADYEGGRLQSFDPTGKFIKQWTVGKGTKSTIIGSMAMDHSGHIFLVTDVTVVEYSASGQLIKTYSMPEDNFANTVAVGADGTLVIGCDNDVIITMTPDGRVQHTINGAFADNGGDDELDVRVAVDGSGNIYALGTFNNAVFKFNRDGKFINRFGSEGDNPGQFTAPDAIAVDGQGRVFVSDFKGVQVFDSNGLYLNVFDPGGAIFGMAFDDQGKLYVASNREAIYKLSIQQPSTGK